VEYSVCFCTPDFVRANDESDLYFGLDAAAVNRDQTRKEDNVLCCDAEAPRRLCSEAAADPVDQRRHKQRYAHGESQPAAGRRHRARALFSQRPSLSAAPGLAPTG
jgi:hypothetical protein